MVCSKTTLLWLLSLLSISVSDVIYVDKSSHNSVNDSSCWTGGIEKPCVSLDLGLLGLKSGTELIIMPGQYMLSNDQTGNFRNLTYVTISGFLNNATSSPSVNISCSRNTQAGFSFEYSNNIVIRNIEFYGCQQLRNSTSIRSSPTANNTFMQMNVSLFFLYCTSVNMTNVIVRNTSGMGIVMYNVVGDTVIDSCHIDNCGNGGLYIEYSYCVPVPFDQGIDCLNQGVSNVDNQYTKNANIFVTNSTFANNTGHLFHDEFNSSTFILPHKQEHSAFGRGGGFSAFFKGTATGNNIKIDKCVFYKNFALWGGAIFAEFQDNAGGNNFTVTSSCIQDNSAYVNYSQNIGTGGGGSRVGFIYFDDFSVYDNKILFDNCTFESNAAYFGGGISFYTAREPGKGEGLNALTIEHCNFKSNSARIGSAIDLSAWHPSTKGSVLTPSIIHCEFSGNYYPPSDGGLIGIGAVYVDTLHVAFYSYAYFKNNSGSALAISGGHIQVMSDCTLVFINNRGRNGAGIALLGNTYIMTNENSSLIFINNTAKYRGGAIYYYSSGERDLISSRDCPLRYSNLTIPPDEWKSSFFFNNNIASGNLGAIFTSSVLPCLWGGAYGNVYANAKEVFCWKTWTYFYNGTKYDKKEGCHRFIESAPFRFTNKSIKLEGQIPGNVPINLTELLEVDNELGYSVTNSSIFIATFDTKDKNYAFESNNGFTYVSHEDLYLYANKSGSISVTLQTLDPIIIQKTIEITFKDCPLGFKIDVEKFQCRCTENYKHYLSCNQTKFASTLSKGTWFGYCAEAKNDTETCVGLSPYMGAVTAKASLDLSNYNNSVSVCANLNREGVLCGNCAPGYCVPVNSEDFSCILTSKSHVEYGWLLYIFTKFFPVTIFFAIMFIFSMTITSGPLNSYIFFAQVITSSIKIHAEGMIPLKTSFHGFKTLQYIYKILYNIWNLNFNEAIPLSYCLSRNFNILSVMSLDYLTAFYPLILLALFVIIHTLYNRGVWIFVRIFRPIHNCFSRLRTFTGIKQSIPGGIAIFILISYTKFTLVSNLLLSFSPLYTANGSDHHNVFYFNGSVNYISGGKKYIATASLVLATFVMIPPLVLIYPSFLEFFRKLSSGRLNLGRLYPGPKIQVFLNEFHGCYKDGSDGGVDCRWFASLYFCLRIIMFTLYAQMNEWDMQYLAQIILFLSMAFLFSIFRPYREDWINSLDTVMFINLAAISTISMFNLLQARLDPDKKLNLGVFVLQMVLVFLPLIYFMVYYFKILVYPLFVVCYKKGKKKYKIKLYQPIEQRVDSDEEYSENEIGMEDSTHVEPFLEFIGNRRRTTDLSNRSFSWRRDRQSTARISVHSHSKNNSEVTPIVTAQSGSSTGSFSDVPSTRNHCYGSVAN